MEVIKNDNMGTDGWTVETLYCILPGVPEKMSVYVLNYLNINGDIFRGHTVCTYVVLLNGIGKIKSFKC